MKVNIGDHKTRLELSKPYPDMAIARQGFIEGRNHPDDIDGMIRLLQRFHSNYYIGRAITAWSQPTAWSPASWTLANSCTGDQQRPSFTATDRLPSDKDRSPDRQTYPIRRRVLQCPGRGLTLAGTHGPGLLFIWR